MGGASMMRMFGRGGVLLLALMVSACSGGGGGKGGDQGQDIRTCAGERGIARSTGNAMICAKFPDGGATGVALSARPYVKFSRAMDVTTLTAATVRLLLPDGTPVPVSFNYDATRRDLMIVPDAGLAPGTTYSVSLEFGIRDAQGEYMAPFTWPFTTAGAGSFSVGGTVTGLSGGELVLLNNGGDALTVTGDGTIPFTFATRLDDGDSYDVTIGTQPTGELCSVSNGSGTIAGADVTDVVVTCGGGAEVNLEVVSAARAATLRWSVMPAPIEVELFVSDQPGFQPEMCGQLNFCYSRLDPPNPYNHFDDVTLPLNRTYYYRLVARFPGGIRVPSPEVSYSPPAPSFSYVLHAENVSRPATIGTYYVHPVTGQPQALGYSTLDAAELTYGMSVTPNGEMVLVAGIDPDNHDNIWALTPTAASGGLMVRNQRDVEGRLLAPLAISGDGRYAFTVVEPDGAPGEIVLRTYALDPLDATIIRVHDFPLASHQIEPVRLAPDPFGERLYVAGRSTVDGSGVLLAMLVSQADGSLSLPPGARVTASGEFAEVVVHPLGGRIYAAERAGGADQLRAYTVNAADTLDAGPVSAAYGRVDGMVMDRNGRFVYGRRDGAIDVYRVAADGSLAQQASVSDQHASMAADVASTLAIDPSGRFLYVAQTWQLGNLDQGYRMAVYRIGDSNGELTLQRTVRTRGAPHAVVFAGSGGPDRLVARSAYAANGGNGTIAMFSANADTGALTAISAPDNPMPTAATGPMQVVMHPTQRWLYAVNNNYAGAGGGGVERFDRSAITGEIGSSIAQLDDANLDPAPTAIAVDPSGNFTYVGTAGGRIRGYNSSGGSLSYNTAGFVDPGMPVKQLLIDSMGRFLYATFSGSNQVYVYAISKGSGYLANSMPLIYTLPAEPAALAMHPSGEAMFVAAAAPTQSIQTYLLDPDSGNLQGPALSAVIPGGGSGYNPVRIAVRPQGDYAYIANSGGRLYAFQVNQSNFGLINGVVQAGFPIDPGDLAIEPQGRFLYLVDRVTNQIYQYGMEVAPTAPVLANSVGTMGTVPRSLAFALGLIDWVDPIP